MNEQPRIKRILAATDLEECATRALEHAKTLAHRFDAEITVVHAVPMYASAEPLPITPIYFGEEPAAEQQAASTALDQYQKTHLCAETSSAPVLEAGDPAVAILATSRSREADMVVMGTHARRGLERALLGSVAEQVIAASEVPVLTVRCHEPERTPRFHRIVCPVNYNSVSAKALRHATLLASAFEAELVVLHLIESADGEDMVRELERLREWVGAVSMSVRARVLVHRGQAAGQVIDYAQRHDVDLIVLGAERKGRESKSVLGSTTHRVTRHAPCPVLTVPAASFERDLRAA
jgi:nucleotide-binding universal stress UspA family protein